MTLALVTTTAATATAATAATAATVTLEEAFEYFKAAWGDFQGNQTEAAMLTANFAWNRLQAIPAACLNDMLLKATAFALYRDAAQTDWGLDPLPEADLRYLQSICLDAQKFAPTVAAISHARLGVNLRDNFTNGLLKGTEHHAHQQAISKNNKASRALFIAAKAIVAEATGLTVQTASMGTKSDRYDCEVEIVSLGDVSGKDLAAFFMAGRAALRIAGRSDAAVDTLSYAKDDTAAAGPWATLGQREAANLLNDPAIWGGVVFLANVVYAYGSVNGQHVPNILNLFKGEITRREFMEWEALSGLRMLAVQ